MDQIMRVKTEQAGGFGPLRRGGALTAVSGLGGALVTLAALLVGVVIALAFAATLFVVMLLASVLLGLAALAWRMRPQPYRRGAVIEARRAGHAWIAYGWDQRPR